MKKRRVVWSVIVATLLILLGVGWYGYRFEKVPQPSVVTDAAFGVSEGQLPDYSDIRVLLGNSHNVFVAKVVREVGERAYPGSAAPTTLFEVSVILNIKGALNGTVVAGDMHGLEPLVSVGTTYLFATRYSPSTGWYLFGGKNTSQVLSENAQLSGIDLKTLAERSDKVLLAAEAYPKEVLRSTDVEKRTAYNSYASRHYDANGELIDDTVELAKQRASAPPVEAAASPAAPAIEAAPSPSPEPIPPVGESAAPSVSAEPTLSPTITPAESASPSPVEESPAPTPSPTEVPIES